MRWRERWRTPLLPSSALLLRGLDALSGMVAMLAESVHQPTPRVPVVETLRTTTARPDARAAPISETPSAAGPDSPHPPHVTVPVSHLDSLLELVEELRATHSELTQAPSGTPETLERNLAR